MASDSDPTVPLDRSGLMSPAHYIARPDPEAPRDIQRVVLVWETDAGGLWDIPTADFPDRVGDLQGVLGRDAAQSFASDLRRVFDQGLPLSTVYRHCGDGLVRRVRHTAVTVGSGAVVAGALETLEEKAPLADSVLSAQAPDAEAGADEPAGTGLEAREPRARDLIELLDTLKDGVCVLDENRRVLLANRAMRKWFDDLGDPESAVCYRRLLDREEPCVDCPTEKTLLNGKTATSEIRRLDDNGNGVAWYEHKSHPYHGLDGRAKVVVLTHDITDQVLRQREEDHRNAVFAGILAASENAIAVFDGHTSRLLYHNRRLADLLNLPGGAAALKELDETAMIDRLASLARRPDAVQAMARKARDHARGRLGREELLDGRTLSVAVEWIPEFEGRPAGPIWNFRDETSDLALAAAVEESRVKDWFLTSMSHEIRTPMNGMLGMAQVLLDTPLDDNQRECVLSIGNSGQELLLVMDSILFFAALEAGRIRLRKTPLNLPDLARETIASLEPSARDRSLILDISHAPETPARFLGDPDAIRRILYNLLHNGVKFTPIGSVRLIISGGDGELRLRVEDTGIGIDPTSLPRLFDRFRQGDEGMARRFGGVGLGLVICKRLVDLMGGTIVVESQPGKGTACTVTLPLTALPDDYPEAPVSLSGRRALLIVSDTAMSVDLNRSLRRAGFDVTAVPRGAEGRLRLRSTRNEGRPFDFVIIEAALPRGGAAAFMEYAGAQGLAEGVHFLLAAPVRDATALHTHPPEGVGGILAWPDSEDRWWQVLDAILDPGRAARAMPDTLIATPRSGSGIFPALDPDILAAMTPGDLATTDTVVINNIQGPAHPVPAALETSAAPESPAAAVGVILPDTENVAAPASSVPSMPRTATATLSAPTLTGASLKGRRILVVEDNRTNRMVLRRMLAPSGCQIDEAVNGVEGLERMRADYYDVILMDCHMPEMDGYEATRQIRNDEKTSGGPRRRIVALTASAIAGDRERCLEAGMNEYLTKPVPRELLIETIRQQLAGSGPG